MLKRGLIFYLLLSLLFAVLEVKFGLLSSMRLTQGMSFCQRLGRLAFWVAIAVSQGATAFAAWKFAIQPKLHGYAFHQLNRPKVISDYPIFYDTRRSEDFAWVPWLESHAEEIIGEVEEFLQSATHEQHFRLAYQTGILSLSPTWKAKNLLSYGFEGESVLPRTMAIMRQIPHIFNCLISRLEKQSEIKPHAGESTCYIRCHLGLIVPAQLPVMGLLVGDQTVSWERGKVLAFCDAHWHCAFNHSDADRYVLIFDVFPQRLARLKSQFCATMMAFTAAQHFVPGRLSLDAPLWRPSILFGHVTFFLFAIPIFAVLYAYLRLFCRTRPRFFDKLADAGFGFYF